MRAGYRAEGENEHGENRAGRQRVAEKRKRAITPSELGGHDARADHGSEQKSRAQRFSHEALGTNKSSFFHPALLAGSGPVSFALPMASSCFCKLSASSDLIGRLTKMLIRLVSMRMVSANA
jgi:hypothetical protein